MRCAKRHQCVYVMVAAQALHVVASDESTQAVANDVDSFIADCGGQLRNGLPQTCRGVRNVVGQQAVVVGGQRLEAAAARCIPSR